MNKTILIGLLAIIFSACGSKTIVRKVPLKITYNEEYCGGTEPTEEMVEQLSTYKAYNGPIYLHSDVDVQRKEEPIIVNVVNGNADLIGLSAGCYFAFHQPLLQVDSTTQDPEMVKCQNMARMNPFLLINIYDYTEPIEGQFTVICDPCSPPAP